jgi:superfamily II DNA/RNA helicase
VEPAPEEVFLPSFEYKDLPVDPQLRGNILNKGYKVPTPIQNESILPIAEGRDVLGIANTGTGKTAAFLIPLLHRALQPGPKERVLILVPTREIATQIFDEFKAFSRGLPLHAAVCVGGLPIFRQIRDLRMDPSFVIATPGRMKDIIERKAINLSRFSRIVLDEADRMVDMGFIKDVRHILSHVPGQRQSLFFSATLPKEVKDLIHSFLHNPITVSVKKQETSMNVDQDVIWVSKTDNKIGMLVDLLRKEHFEKVLIFARTKRGVDKLTKFLHECGFAVACIHGDKEQNQRQRALDAFKAHRIKILVATDVAARGLDIPNVSHVINYDAPEAYEDYVHRIGRTGRAGKKGHALTFVERRY